MKYVAIFHANLNYAYLEPHKYEQVIRASYETIIDTFAEKCPDAKYVFEASGYTIDQMAKLTPDVLAKLVRAVERGQCEFMGAPYAHPIMANVPEEDGYWSNVFSMRTYERHLGFKPESVWNPECTWMQHVPRTFQRAGYKYMTLDFESYMISNDKDYGFIERNRTRDIGWGGHLPWYDLDPDCRFLHQPFRDIVPGLHGMCRSDRLIGKYVGYFLDQIPLEAYMDAIRKWTGTKNKGATIIIADDAEYTGTTGYYFVKHFRDYSRSFAVDPGAAAKLERLVNEVLKLGEMVTFKEACELEPVDEPFYVEDHMAWHRTYADAWAGTPEAKAWEPILMALRAEYKEKYQARVESDPGKRELGERFWFHLTNAANSDGRWPPPPAITCPFNRQWVQDEIEAARKTLVEIAETLKGSSHVTMPCGSDAKDDELGGYGLHFTDKNTENVRGLNTYELSHALYKYASVWDNGTPDQKANGERMVHAILEEFERRHGRGLPRWCL
jgi:hypothetical protein